MGAACGCRLRAVQRGRATPHLIVDGALSTSESWRPRAEIAEGGDRGPEVVAREDRARLAPSQVLGRELAGAQLAPARHLQRDPHVLREVDPGQVVAERRQRRDLLPAEVVV